LDAGNLRLRVASAKMPKLMPPDLKGVRPNGYRLAAEVGQIKWRYA
jgi:hypothetical protein